MFPETNLDEAGAVAERLRAAVADEPIKVGDNALGGHRLHRPRGVRARARLDKLFQRADAALYTAKQTGVTSSARDRRGQACSVPRVDVGAPPG